MAVFNNAGAGADDGFVANTAESMAALSRYGRARMRLLGLEGRETLKRLAVAGGLAVGALGAAVFGYIFIVLTVTFAIARAFGGGKAWLWVAGAMALLHLLAAAGAGWFAWQRIREPLFPRNLEELRKDEAWLHRQARN